MGEGCGRGVWKRGVEEGCVKRVREIGMGTVWEGYGKEIWQGVCERVMGGGVRDGYRRDVHERGMRVGTWESRSGSGVWDKGVAEGFGKGV